MQNLPPLLNSSSGLTAAAFLTGRISKNQKKYPNCLRMESHLYPWFWWMCDCPTRPGENEAVGIKRKLFGLSHLCLIMPPKEEGDEQEPFLSDNWVRFEAPAGSVCWEGSPTATVGMSPGSQTLREDPTPQEPPVPLGPFSLARGILILEVATGSRYRISPLGKGPKGSLQRKKEACWNHYKEPELSGNPTWLKSHPCAA